MSGPRRKLFGPLFYSTVVVAVVVTAWAEIFIGLPVLDDWLREQSLSRSLRADDYQVREAAATARNARLKFGHAAVHRGGPRPPARMFERWPVNIWTEPTVIAASSFLS